MIVSVVCKVLAEFVYLAFKLLLKEPMKRLEDFHLIPYAVVLDGKNVYGGMI